MATSFHCFMAPDDCNIKAEQLPNHETRSWRLISCFYHFDIVSVYRHMAGNKQIHTAFQEYCPNFLKIQRESYSTFYLKSNLEKWKNEILIELNLKFNYFHECRYEK